MLLTLLLTLLQLQTISATPNSIPTVQPSPYPSLRPSVDTRNPLQTVTIVDCQLTFLPAEDSGAQQMALMPGSSSISDWEEITGQHIADYLGSIQKQVSDVIVTVTFIDQAYVPAEDFSTSADENLMIEFYTRVTFRDITEEKDYDVYEGVGDAFITWNSGQNYIKKLNEVNPDVFAKPQNILVYVPNRPVDIVPTSAPFVSSSTEGLSLQLIIVIIACAGGGFLILLMAYFYVRNHKNSELSITDHKFHSHSPRTSSPSGKGTGQQVQVSTYIVTKPIGDEDISTLGYPTVTKPPGLAGSQVYGATKDEDISTLGEPTIFGAKSTAKPYKLSKQSSDTSDQFSSASDSILGGMNANAAIYGSSETIATNPTLATSAVKKFTNPRNGRNFFEFNAPVGSLGIMIDMTALRGPHRIQAIKDDSVLSDILHVGDRIVSFDDEDVGMMSAMELTQLIASRGNQPSRKFVIVRS